MKILRLLKTSFLFLLIVTVLFFAFKFYARYVQENKILKEIISRLEADSRIAEVLVTGVNYDEKSKKTYTTIKFLEYDTNNNPLKPKYFTFSGNIIQFQSLVIRFDDIHIRKGDGLRGKSAYIFWKIFMLDGPNTEEHEITKLNEIPMGYKLEKEAYSFEEKLWKKFWAYALHPEDSRKAGIKNVQIEAPGTMFIPGMLYTLRIEHDGGIRIDVAKLPHILRGETVPE